MLNSATRRKAFDTMLRDAGITNRSGIRPVPRDLGVLLPLSFAQQRLWLMDQLLPGSAAYNVPYALRLRGRLQVPVLRRALAAVVARHEVLRTCYPVVRGEPVQRVIPGTEFGWWVRDVSGSADPESVAWEIAVTEGCEPFNLSTGPVLRAGALRVGIDDHLLLLTVHHIAADGWSSGILAGEVLAFYEAFVRDDVPALQELPVQYVDFAVWQRNWLSGEVLDRELDYWRQRLAGVPLLELPSHVARPAVLSGRGMTRRFELSVDVSARLRELARAEGVTLFMVLVAGFCAALYRMTGQTDIAIGTQIANRNRAEIEPLIGFFVNTLVLRTDVGGDPTFRELLSRVRKTTLAAYAHQDLPFERLVQELRPDRDLAHGVPLFNVDCMLQNAPYPTTRAAGLDITIVDRHTYTAKSDLGLMFWEPAGQGSGPLVGWYEYSTDLFNDAAVDGFVRLLLRVVEQAAHAPGTRMSELAALSAEEVREQLHVWNHEPSRPVPAETAVDLFDAMVSEHEARPALVRGDVAMTYGELGARANALAHRLSGLGVGQEDRVAVLADHSFDTFVGLFGVLKAGAAFVPLSPTVPPVRQAAVIRDSGAWLVVVPCDARPPDLPGVATLPVPPRSERRASGPPVRPDGRRLAYLMYTSGSTGTPKGVMIEQRGLANLARWLRATIYHMPEGLPRIGSFNADPVSDAFVEDLCLLLLGATVHLPGAQLRRDPVRFASFLRERRVELFQCSPTQIRSLLAAGLFEPGHRLHTVIVAGEHIDQPLWDRLAAQPDVAIWNVYGPTECTVDSSAARIEPGAATTIGHPVANTLIRMLDRDANLVPVGVRGEICVGGVQVGRGYAGRAAQTALAFVPDPFAATPGSRLYRTGDIGSYLPDGRIRIHGRRDDQVKIRGFRVELGEIEATLAEHPDVADVRADIAVTPAGEPRLVAYLVAREEIQSGSSAAELVDQWRQIFDVQQGGRGADATFDTSGWVDTASQRALAAGEMREWLAATVSRIRRLPCRRVLEVGCGTGLILFQLLGVAERYVGLDFSAATFDKTRRAVEAAATRTEVSLREATAHHVGELAEEFDTAIFNSVVQYFPTEDYLREALVQAVRRIGPAGAVFLGDLRSPAQLELTHLWIESVRMSGTATVEDLAGRVERAVARERELLVAPELLESFAAGLGGAAWVEHCVHEGRSANELVRLRYDAVLRPGPPDHVVEPDWVAWSPGMSLDTIKAALAEDPDRVLAVRGIPNARLHRERAAAEAITERRWTATLAEAIAAGPREGRGLDPQDLFDLAAGHGREARLTWTPGRADGAVDLVALPRCLAGARVRIVAGHAGDTRSAAPSPLATHVRDRLLAQVRTLAQDRLPRHMVPDAFVVLDRIPIDSAGKLDRRALPAPDLTEVREGTAVPLSGADEETVARVWERVLGVRDIGADADFFRLGGHSLLATSVANELNALFGVELGVRDIFENPVLRDLCECIGRYSEASSTTSPPLLPALRDAFMPLSFAQQRLWLMDRLAPGSAAYNVAYALRLRGELRVPVLRRALAAVVGRHEVLRTRYPVVHGEPVQHVVPEAEFGWWVRDLSGCTDPESMARDVAVAEGCEPFDLATGPVLRAGLLRLGPADQVLSVTVHHIAADGWSSGILAGEVLANYAAFARGDTPALEDLPVQYADFAAWQRNRLSGEVLERELAYWRQRLAGAPMLELPSRLARPAVLSGRGLTRRFELPVELSSRLRELARAEGVTLFMVLVAGFCAAVYRLTGQTDVVIGSVTSGRNHPEIEPLVGFFVNTLVLRTDVGGDPTFRELLSRVRETTLGAHAHQDLPFERLVKELRPGEGRTAAAREPFDVMFQLDDTRVEAAGPAGVTVESWEIDKGTAKFPVAVTAWQEDAALAFSVQYATDTFAGSDIDRLMSTFTELLDRMSRDATDRMGGAPC